MKIGWTINQLAQDDYGFNFSFRAEIYFSNIFYLKI